MIQQNSSEADLHLAPVRASYFQRVHNIGDAVTPYLLESVAGRPAVSARSTDLPYILSIGSLIQTSTPQSFIWGTGLIHPSEGTGNPDPRRILAVRGKLTQAELVRNGIRVGDVPLGDPGILIPRLLPRSSAAPRFSLGLVPHVFDREHPFFVEAANDPSVKVLDVCSPAEEFFADLASCRAIASSSLHGLVFGEALGLPTLYLVVSENFVGGQFKFSDWFSLARNPQREPVRPRSFVSAAEIVAQCEPRQVEIDIGALMQALTSDVIESCSRTSQPRHAIIPVSACRARPLPVFIVSHNEAGNLQRMIASCRRQDRTVEIAVYDDGSDDPETVVLLSRLERDGVWVHRRGRDDPPELWQRVNNALDAFFRDWAEPSRYAVTRCDVDFSTAGVAALDLYDDLLDRFPRSDSVGPAIAKLPSERAGVETVVNGRVASAANRMPGAAAIAPWRCIIVDGGFDLGFAVYRAGKSLLATMKSLRVNDPH
jgi:pyruvyltransferase